MSWNAAGLQCSALRVQNTQLCFVSHFSHSGLSCILLHIAPCMLCSCAQTSCCCCACCCSCCDSFCCCLIAAAVRRVSNTPAGTCTGPRSKIGVRKEYAQADAGACTSMTNIPPGSLILTGSLALMRCTILMRTASNETMSSMKAITMSTICHCVIEYLQQSRQLYSALQTSPNDSTCRHKAMHLCWGVVQDKLPS